MRKIFYGIAILSAILLITGCGNKKVEPKKDEQSQVKEEAKTKELVIYDAKTKYSTSLTYDKEKKYEIKKTINDGKFVEVIFELPEKNLKFDVYYFENTKDGYETSKNNRKESKEFKEYVWNKYNGYTYNGDKYSIDFNILFEEIKDTNMVVGLFGTVESIDNKSANVIEDFNSEEVQKLLDTITFKIG